jgi:hypothetical protein
MAKCIMYPNGTITRVDDDDAEFIVGVGAASYTSKSKWKAYAKDDIKTYRLQVAAKNKIKNKIMPVKNAKKEARRLARLERFRKEHGLRRAA